MKPGTTIALPRKVTGLSGNCWKKRRRRRRNVYIPMRPPTSEVFFFFLSLHWELSAREAGEGRAAKVKAWMCPCLLGAPLSCRMRLDWRRQLGWWAENRERAQRGGAGLTSSSPWSCGGMRARTHARAATHTHTHTHAVSFFVSARLKTRDCNATHCQNT